MRTRVFQLWQLLHDEHEQPGEHGSLRHQLPLQDRGVHEYVGGGGQGELGVALECARKFELNKRSLFANLCGEYQVESRVVNHVERLGDIGGVLGLILRKKNPREQKNKRKKTRQIEAIWVHIR